MTQYLTAGDFVEVFLAAIAGGLFGLIATKAGSFVSSENKKDREREDSGYGDFERAGYPCPVCFCLVDGDKWKEHSAWHETESEKRC